MRKGEGLGEKLSPPPCIFSEQELESPSLYPVEWHDQAAKSCLGFPVWSVVIGRQGSRPLVCASTMFLQSSLQAVTSSQASHSFREGYLPLPQWHLSALANLVPSFPTPFPDKKKYLERSSFAHSPQILKHGHLQTALD